MFCLCFWDEGMDPFHCTMAATTTICLVLAPDRYRNLLLHSSIQHLVSLVLLADFSSVAYINYLLYLP